MCGHITNISIEMYVLQRNPTVLANGPGNVSLQGPGCNSCGSSEGLSRLPTGFPLSISGESTWNGKLDQTRYTYHLTGDDLVEIRQGVDHFLGTVTPSSLTSCIQN